MDGFELEDMAFGSAVDVIGPCPASCSGLICGEGGGVG